MPLPSGGAWPPVDHAQMLDQMRVWRAWWTGDPRDLTSAYTKPKARPAQYQGGLVGSVARMFWGKPIPTGEQLSKSHVPVAADIATMSADLLFAEPPKLVFDDTVDDATKERVDTYVENGLWAELREGAESCAALGGTYIRVVWDRTVSDTPWLACVDANFAVPEFRWGRLTAVTFWHEIEKTSTEVVRLLERHEPGHILYGVFVGTPDNLGGDLGRRVPLTDYEATTGLAESLTDGDTVVTGYDGLTAVYVPNMRPNKVWELPLGRSDYAGVEPTMDELDEVMTSWMRDVRLAKARLMVPELALTSMGKGRGAVFDADQELFVPIPGANPTETSPTLVQPGIRFVEHQESAQYRIEAIVRGAGYSMATFSPTSDGAAAVTATEIAQREKRSLTTRDKKIRYWTPAIVQVIEALLAVDAAQFGASVTPVKPSVTFPDAVSPDPESVARTIQMLSDANALTDRAKIAMLHPEYDEAQLDETAAEMSGTEVERAATAMSAIASLATNLGKAVQTGGLTENQAGEIIKAVLAKVKDENGEPIDTGPADFGGAAIPPEPAIGGPGAAGGPGGAARPAARPATGGTNGGPGRG